MRRPIIAGNWKMNKTVNEAIGLVNLFKRSFYQADSYQIDAIDIVVCPPFTALGEVSEILVNSNIMLGAQDVYWQTKGAYTGEISPLMLKDTGCRFVIIGHSERRKYFGETNLTVNKKLKAALEAGLMPIVCVGECLEEREEGRALDVVRDHIENGLDGITKQQLLNAVIAYEPVWAIGTGKTATPQQAEEVHKFIRTLLEKKIRPGYCFVSKDTIRRKRQARKY